MWWLKHILKNNDDSGVIGINYRNIEIINPYNSRRLFPLVNEKMQTKKILYQANIPSPKVIGYYPSQLLLPKLKKVLEREGCFVLKPNRGCHGSGIKVIKRQNNQWLNNKGEEILWPEIKLHLLHIFAGEYSLGYFDDGVMVEEYVQTHPDIAKIGSDGCPDIRLLAFKGVPIMAMIRVPTIKSEGRGNLHQGAVGLGIDLTTGYTNYAILYDEPITHHPDTHYPLTNILIPHWDDILQLPQKLYDVLPLGYVGIDIVIEQHQGIMVLEVNARPGLSIQNANKAGLKKRIQALALI